MQKSYMDTKKLIKPSQLKLIDSLLKLPETRLHDKLDKLKIYTAKHKNIVQISSIPYSADSELLSKTLHC